MYRCSERSEYLKNVELTKSQRRNRNLKRSSIACFSVALALVFITYIFTLPEVQKSLQDLNAWFERIEYFIAQYDKLAAFGLITALFLFKSVVPIIPFSVLFISSGMVFSAPVAVAVNALGFALLVAIKFLSQVASSDTKSYLDIKSDKSCEDNISSKYDVSPA